MPTRPDLRDIAANVKEAFADADRETLLEVLTFVIKEYVVEGPPPMLVHQVENLADLANLSFAQLVTALQTRLDHAELGLFAVDGEQVSVRIGGVMHPIMPGRGAAPAAELPRPSAGVRVVETNVTRPAPAAAAPAAQTARHSAPPPAAASGAAPPPARGLSMRGRPTGEGAPDGGEAPAPAPAPVAAPQAVPEKKEGSGDDASARFSLLELD